jgi:hypothetical protein
LTIKVKSPNDWAGLRIENPNELDLENQGKQKTKTKAANKKQASIQMLGNL